MGKEGKHIDKNKESHFSRGKTEKYLEGKLSEQESHELEKEALDSPFLYEAMEGLESVTGEAFSDDMKILQERLNQRIGQEDHKSAPILWWRYAAAAVILVIGSMAVFNLFEIQTVNEQSELAMEELSEEEDALQRTETDTTPKDTLIIKDNALALNEEKEEDLKPAIPTISETKTNKVSKGNAQGVTPIRDEDAFPDNFEEDELTLEIEESSEVDALSNESIDKSDHPSDMVAERSPENDHTTEADVNPFLSSTDAEAKEDASSEVSGKKSLFEKKEKPKKGKTKQKGKKRKSRGKGRAMMKATEINEEKHQARYASPEQDGTENSANSEEDIFENKVIVTRTASPKNGINSYQVYLATRLRYPEAARNNQINGKVVLTFTVSSNGSLKNFQILQPLGFGCDEEAIRLVKEGPEWNPAQVEGNFVEDKVTIELNF